MITAHGKKVLLVKGDYHPAEVYAGVERVATEERTNIVAVQEGEGTPAPGVQLSLDDISGVGTLTQTLSCVLPAGEYRFTARVESNDTDNTRSGMFLVGTDAEKTWISWERGREYTQTINLTHNITDIIFYPAFASAADSQGDLSTWANLRIDSGNIRSIHGTDSVEVECTDGSHHTVSLPHTSYGGYIDWSRRKYVETHVRVRLDELEWKKSGVLWSAREQSQNNIALPASNTNYPDILSSMYATRNVNGMTGKESAIAIENTGNSAYSIYICDIGATAEDEFLEHLQKAVFVFRMKEPVGYDIFLPNGVVKYAGWHEKAQTVADEPVVFSGTYNDQVRIAATGNAYQETMPATIPVTGSFVQAEIPAGQPLDVRVNIAATEIPPSTNLVQKTVPAVFEDSVAGDVLLSAHGVGFQQTFDATEVVSGQLVQMELPPEQPIDVKVSISAIQDGEGEPAPGVMVEIPDQVFTQYKAAFLERTLPEGDYRLSGTFVSADTDSDRCIINGVTPEGNQAWSILVERGSVVGAPIHTERPFNRINFYAANGNDAGEGDQATFTALRIESGNLRPIHGVSRVRTTVCGINLFDAELFTDIAHENEYPEDKICLNEWGGFDASNVSYGERKTPYEIPCKPNTQYRLEWDYEWLEEGDSRVQCAFQVRYTNGTYNTRTMYADSPTGHASLTSASSQTVESIRFGNWGYSGKIRITNIRLIEMAQPALPFNGLTATVNLPQESYGGYIDFERKKYVRTRKLLNVDSSHNIRQDSDLVFLNVVMDIDSEYKPISSIARWNLHPNREGWFMTYSGAHYLRFGKYDEKGMSIKVTVEEFKQLLDDIGGIQVAYPPVSGPVEYDLTDLPDLKSSQDGITSVYTDATTVTASGTMVPSPAHPSEIKGSHGIITSSARNLFEPELGSGLVGFTVELDESQQVYTINGTSVGPGNLILRGNFDILLDDNETATLSTEILSGAFDTSNATGTKYIYYALFGNGYHGYIRNSSGYNLENAGSISAAGTLSSYKGVVMVIQFGSAGIVANSVKLRIQVERGAITHKWSPYHQPKEISLPVLRAIPGSDIQDELRPVLGKPGWYDVIHNVEVYEINGEEHYAIAGAAGAIFSGDFGARVNTDPVVCSCSHYKNVKNGVGLWTGTEDCACITANGYFGGIGSRSFAIRDSRFNSVEEYKQFFMDQYAAGTPIVCWYASPDPITERLYLGDLKSYPQTTIVDITGDLVPEGSAKVLVEAENGAGTKEPGNPSVISGADEVRLLVCGKNLANPAHYQYREATQKGFTEGAPCQSWGFPIFTPDITHGIFRQGMTYTISAKIECVYVPEGATLFGNDICVYLNDGQGGKLGFGNIRRTLSSGEVFEYRETATIPGNFDAYPNAFLGWYTNRYTIDGAEALVKVMVREFQIEVGSEQTAYTPYSGVTQELALPETSYGGCIDWTRGKYMQSHSHYVFTGEEHMNVYQNFVYVDIENVGASYDNIHGTCTHWPYQTYGYEAVGISPGGSSAIFGCGNRDYTASTGDIDDLREFLKSQHDRGTPVEVVYRLSTPIEHDLDLAGLFASSDGLTTACTDAEAVTLAGGAVPSPFHSSEMMASNGAVTVGGKNLIDIPEVTYNGLQQNYTSFALRDAFTSLPKRDGYRFWYHIDMDGREVDHGGWLGIYYKDAPDSQTKSMYVRNGEAFTMPDYIQMVYVAVAGVEERTDDGVYRFYDFCITCDGSNPREYTPYRSQMSISLPVLRAIPGTDIRDELISVKGMPGWYDVTRNVVEHVVDGREGHVGDPNHYAHENTTNVGLYVTSFDHPYNRRMMCNRLDFVQGVWSTDTQGTCLNNQQIHLNLNNSVTGVTEEMTPRERRNRVSEYLQEQHDRGTPYIVWGRRAKPTVERIYLGVLRTYPKYTSIEASGTPLPDITASVKVVD